MQTGLKCSELPPDEALGRLKTAMAGGNFEIVGEDSGVLSFRHGTLLTQTGAMIPKRGVVRVKPDRDGSEISYEVEAYGFGKYWMLFFAIAFCWLIFPPIIVSRVMKHQPKLLMQNLLQSA